MTVHQFIKFLKLYKSFIISIGLIIACFIVIVFFTIPTGRTVYDIFVTSGNLNEEVEGLERKQRVLAAADDLLLQEQLAGLVSAIPLEKSLATVFTTAENLGAQTAIAIEDFEVLQAGSVSTIAAVPTTSQERAIGASIVNFTLGVRGAATDLRAFLAQSNRVRRLMRVDSLNISFSADGSGKLVMEMSSFFSPLAKIKELTPEATVISPAEEEILSTVLAFPILSQVAGPATSADETVVLPVGKPDPFSP